MDHMSEAHVVWACHSSIGYENCVLSSSLDAARCDELKDTLVEAAGYMSVHELQLGGHETSGGCTSVAVASALDVAVDTSNWASVVNLDSNNLQDGGIAEIWDSVRRNEWRSLTSISLLKNGLTDSCLTPIEPWLKDSGGGALVGLRQMYLGNDCGAVSHLNVFSCAGTSASNQLTMWLSLNAFYSGDGFGANVVVDFVCACS